MEQIKVTLLPSKWWCPQCGEKQYSPINIACDDCIEPDDNDKPKETEHV